MHLFGQLDKRNIRSRIERLGAKRDSIFGAQFTAVRVLAFSNCPIDSADMVICPSFSIWLGPEKAEREREVL
jgi:hypothetical protein